MKNSPLAFALNGRTLFSTLVRADTVAVQTSVMKRNTTPSPRSAFPTLPNRPLNNTAFHLYVIVPSLHGICSRDRRGYIYSRARRCPKPVPSMHPSCRTLLEGMVRNDQNSHVDIHACIWRASTCTNQAATSGSHLRKHSYNAKVTESIHIYHTFSTSLRERKGSGVRSCHCMLIFTPRQRTTMIRRHRIQFSLPDGSSLVKRVERYSTGIIGWHLGRAALERSGNGM